MLNKILADRKIMLLVLFLQLIPLLVFPASVYKPTSQEWWLAIILGGMALAGLVPILRRSPAIWPWYLMGFAQGFNIISRIMMVWAQIIVIDKGSQYFNTSYTLITIAVILLSTFLLSYFERPDVRLVMLRK